VVVSGVTTYQSSRSAVWRGGRHGRRLCIRLADWSGVDMSKGVGRWGSGGKKGSRVTNWAQMSMTISCTWAWQSTDQHLRECCLRLSGYWYGWPWRVWGGRDPRNVGHLAHPLNSRSSGTLGTVGGGEWGMFVASFMSIGCTFRRIDPRTGT